MLNSNQKISGKRLVLRTWPWTRTADSEFLVWDELEKAELRTGRPSPCAPAITAVLTWWKRRGMFPSHGHKNPKRWGFFFFLKDVRIKLTIAIKFMTFICQGPYKYGHIVTLSSSCRCPPSEQMDGCHLLTWLFMTLRNRWGCGQTAHLPHRRAPGTWSNCWEITWQLFVFLQP